MNFPLSIFSDASLEWGNDLPGKMVSTAKDRGYQRVALVDNDSMSAVVKFINATKEQDVGAIVGSTLTVYCQDRDEHLWSINAESQLSKLAGLFGLNCTPGEGVFSYASLSPLKAMIGALNSVMQSSTPIKAKNALDKLISEGLISESMPLIGIEAGSVTAADIKKYDETKFLQQVFYSTLPEAAWPLVNSPSKWPELASLIKTLSFDLPMGKIMFYASSDAGYKQLLRLSSMKAKRKSASINASSKEPVALHFSDIVAMSEEEGLEVKIVDPLTPYSVIGALGHSSEDKALIASRVQKVVSKYGTYIDAVGIPLGAGENVIYAAKESQLSVIPLPTAHFASKDDYDDYCVKVAVHRDEEVLGFLFKKPDEKAFIHENSSAVEFYQNIPGIKLNDSFWSTEVNNTPVTLGEVHLPNYDMPVKEVIEHAFSVKGIEHKPFDSIESASSAFDEWVTKELPEGTAFSAYRQRRLNDFCMHKITMDGLPDRLHQRYGDNVPDEARKEYLDRIAYEFDVIESMGFSGYFLIEFDFVSHARKIGVPVGPGRGSAAGSLIVYCMEITDVDPIEHGLQFERFLNPERVSMPDIDVDFGDGGTVNRATVLEYIRKKYQMEGADFPSSSQIANINRYQLKSALAAVRRVHNLSMTFDRELKKLVSDAEQSLGISAPKNIKWDELMEVEAVQQRIQREPMLKRILEKARALTGKMSSYGVHAGGVVISPTTITDFSALACDDNGNFFTQFDKDDIERAGLIKFDVLGLRTLSILVECVKQVKANHGITVDPRYIDMNDPSVYALICDQVLADIFQLESGGMRELVGSLQPNDIGELAVLSALYRPGALDSGMVEEYIEVKHGKRRPKYDHPSTQVVTEETFGCIVYQEQVMSMVRQIAGYSLGQADLLRRAMGKKKFEEMVKQRTVYSSKAMAFWREHYLEIGKKQGFEFKLDVNLKDLSDELSQLQIQYIVDEDGYIGKQDSVISAISTLLSFEEGDKKKLVARLADYNYTVMLFKEHYQGAIVTAVNAGLSELDKNKLNEVSTRLYYAISQYVRFGQIFNKIEKFAGYGFNKSHAIAYSVVTYMTAYFKRYYPAEFYSAALSFKNLDALYGTVLEATQKMGVKIVGPDINKSQTLFSVEDGMKVRYGLGKLKNMGGSAPEIVQERTENGYFKGVFDFLERMKHHPHTPDSRAFAALATTGAFDRFIPERIMRDKALNGRQFVVWMRDAIVKSKAYKSGEAFSRLHMKLNEMSEIEFYAYLTAISPPAVIKSMNWTGRAKSDGDEGTTEKVDTAFDDVSNKLVIKALSGKVSKKAEPNIVNDSRQLVEMDMGRYSALSDIVSLYEEGRNTDFELLFMRACVALREVDGATVWHDYLAKNVNKPVTETLNEERDAAGFYMTSTPIKVLKIADKVEREPPSSVIDGCPVEVGRIDGSYDETNVTTYGIIRQVVVKTVKNENSPSYGEKMLFFVLEDGAETINCMIFGTKQTNMFLNKVVQEGAVSMVAGEISMNDFGITLKVNAIKRYYPTEDEKLHVVPRR
tara:strand:- start:10230 stop:14819 length:4590 start_codon:yes stop_codon:yes gene_type:complete